MSQRWAIPSRCSRAHSVFALEPSRQKGAALISVMFVLSIALVLATQEMRQTAKAIKVSNAGLMSTQGYWYARAGEALGRQMLAEDWRSDYAASGQDGGSMGDHLGESWAQPFNSFGLADGDLRMQIFDLQSRYNVNNLRAKDTSNAAAAEHSIRQIFAFLNLSEAALAELRSSVLKAQWHDVSMLNTLAVINDTQRQALSRILVALPTADASLNINTASEETLFALFGEKNAKAVRELIRERSFSSITDLHSTSLSMLSGTSTKLDVRSEFFDIQTAASFLEQQSYLSTKVHRAEDGQLSIIARSSGKHTIMNDISDRLLVSNR